MLSTYQEEFDAIAAAFAAAWNNLTPVEWPNVALSPPAGPWARFNMIPGGATQASIGAPGSNIVRYAGTIDIQLFVPRKTGLAELNRLAENAIEILDSIDVEGIRVGRAYLTYIPPASDDVWQQGNVRVKYTRDSLK